MGLQWTTLHYTTLGSLDCTPRQDDPGTMNYTPATDHMEPENRPVVEDHVVLGFHVDRS